MTGQSVVAGMPVLWLVASFSVADSTGNLLAAGAANPDGNYSQAGTQLIMTSMCWSIARFTVLSR